MGDLLKANALALALGRVTNTTPVVLSDDRGYIVSWTEEEKPAIQAYFRKLMSKKSGEPSRVRLDYDAAIYPVLVEKYGAALFLTGALLLFTGYSMKRRRK